MVPAGVTSILYDTFSGCGVYDLNKKESFLSFVFYWMKIPLYIVYLLIEKGQ